MLYGRIRVAGGVARIDPDRRRAGFQQRGRRHFCRAAVGKKVIDLITKCCGHDGVVMEVDGRVLIVEYKNLGRTVHRLLKFDRSNQDTCINQKPRVTDGRC